MNVCLSIKLLPQGTLFLSQINETASCNAVSCLKMFSRNPENRSLWRKTSYYAALREEAS